MGWQGSQTKVSACVGVALCRGPHKLLSGLHSLLTVGQHPTTSPNLNQGLPQTSPMDIEGLGYNPPNTFVRSLAPLIPQPSCVKPCHNAHQPHDDPRTHGFRLNSITTRWPPTWGIQGSRSHTDLRPSHPHTPLGTVNPRTQDPGLSSQKTITSVDHGLHLMRDPAPVISVFFTQNHLSFSCHK